MAVRSTIVDIAAYCKVSVGTVDRAINNRPGISDQTRKQILEAVEKLNYKLDYTGRSLATGFTKTIGIVCFDLYNNFFPELIDTIENAAKAKGYFIYLILTHMDKDKEWQGLEYLSMRHVDGIIMFPIGVGDEFVQYLKGLHIPIVTVFNELSDDFYSVSIDNRGAFGEAVDFLVGRGYKRIAFLTPQVDKQESCGNNVHILKMRRMGYCDGVIRAGLEPIILQGRTTSEQMSLYYANHEQNTRTALLCSNDLYALMIFSFLQDKGERIPETLGIMGFDNVKMLNYIRPKLTTVEYSVKSMGEQLFNCVYAQIQGASNPQKYVLPHEIVVGETV
jgi:LacI family transcriptional regulator